MAVEPLLSTIQTAVKTRLETIDYLVGITVLTESRGDIISQMESKLLSTGVGILVMTPAAFVSAPNQPGPYFHQEGGGIRILCQIYENVAVNQGSQGSQKPASTIAETVLAALHLYHPAGLGVIIAASGEPAIQAHAETGYLIYDVNLWTHGGLELT